ncbi:hypothetical protein VTN00DRAFT_5186 [Thermoascus crustaceus]|uniref:uncharacterized protein n=1 Tax=Thermoascus crustaceus TaxID=5088 RepID=UPI003744A047
MPTFTIYTSTPLTPHQRHSLASRITTIHHDENSVGHLPVRVIFLEQLSPGFQFKLGHAVPADKIYIRGDVRIRQCPERKRLMSERLVKECSWASGIEEGCFWIFICDFSRMVEPKNTGPGGKRKRHDSAQMVDNNNNVNDTD